MPAFYIPFLLWIFIMKLVPHLGGEGWVADPARQLNLLFAHALVADGNQSTIYKDTITSIPFIVAQYQDSPQNMATNLQEALTTYFSRFFATVDVEVNVNNVLNHQYTLYLSVIVTATDGNTYSLAFESLVDQGSLKAVLTALN